MTYINETKAATVIDKYGTEIAVDWSGEVTLVSYDNKRGYIEWNVPQAADTFFYTDVLVAGKVDSVRLRLRAHGNVGAVMVAIYSRGREEREQSIIRESVAKYVIDNQQLFFTKCGNWRKNNQRQQQLAIREVCKNVIRKLEEAK